jgi:hypothetical protein
MPNVGYMVVLRYDDGHLGADWDGCIHPTQAAANGECIEAKRNGFDAFTVSLISREVVPE